MSMIHIRYKGVLVALGILCAAVTASPAQGASFDCAKAKTKVEHMICDNPELSKLDDQMAGTFKSAQLENGDRGELVRGQRKWLSERNTCSDTACLKSAYEKRLADFTMAPYGQASSQKGEVEYRLLMSKDNNMCNHMLTLMNDDLQHSDRVYDSFDSFIAGIEEFTSIPWAPAKAQFEYHGHLMYSNDLEGAVFDLNNDGVPDFVVRVRGMLSGMSADAIYMLDRNVASRADSLTFTELRNAKNQIGMAGSAYHLSPPLAGQVEPLWRLAPFRYDGVTYIYMQSLYEKGDAIGNDFVVIARYVGGTFVNRNMTGKMQDICYIQRARS